MKLKIILLILLNIIFSACTFDDSFDKKLLKDFKIFQETIAKQPDKTFNTTDSYRWIVKTNFNRLFSFTNKNFKDRFTKLFNQNDINRIEINHKKCIQFRIRPDYDNSLLKSEWNELWIIYNSGCDCVCHKKLNGYPIPKENIKKIDTNWYKVISKKKRYIGG